MDYYEPELIFNIFSILAVFYTSLLILYCISSLRTERDSLNEEITELQKECDILKEQGDADASVINTLKNALREMEENNEQLEENLNYIKLHVISWSEVHKNVLPRVASIRHNIRESHEELWSAIYDKESYEKLAIRQKEVKKVIKDSLSIVDDLLRSFEAEFVRSKIEQEKRIDFLENHLNKCEREKVD
jgi:chromosome segregation ATPase